MMKQFYSACLLGLMLLGGLNACDHGANTQPEASKAAAEGLSVDHADNPAAYEHRVLYGIDVSHYQKKILWDKVAASGAVEFVFVKASQGDDSIDAQYEYNWTQTAAHSLLRGVYHYFDAAKDPEAQAQHFLRTTQGDFGNFPPVIDIEAFENENAAALMADLKVFIATLQNAGACQPIIYTSRGFWNQLDDHDFGHFPLWVADYNENLKLPNGWSNWLFWQFESNALIDGIDGQVDKSRFQGMHTQLQTLACH